MIGMCDSWDLDQMGDFRQEKIRTRVLDEGWDKGQKVISPDDVGQCPSVRAEKIIGRYCAMLGGWAGIGGFIGGTLVGSVGLLTYLRHR